MANNGVQNRHSETALIAVMIRAAAAEAHPAGTLGFDYLARCFLAPALRFLIGFEFVRTRFKKKNDDLTPGGFEYVVARIMFFDEVFADAIHQEIPQIVILGAGYDTRAYRFSSTKSKIYELDAPTTQNRKISCLKKIKVETETNITYVPIDFNQHSIEDNLERAGYIKTDRTLFLWEGVSMYLEPAAVAATLNVVASNENNRILFDCVVSIPESDPVKPYGVSRFMETWSKRRREEPFLFTIGASDIESWLGSMGLRTYTWSLGGQARSLSIPVSESSMGAPSTLSRRQCKPLIQAS